MNYSEMLHDFLDSSLNGPGEETLFRALASDDELRFEMKYLLKLRDAVRDDDEARVVPVASTNAIFGQLGYTAPAAIVGAAGGIAGAQSGLWPLLKSAGGYLLAMLAGAFVTAGVFIATDDTSASTPNGPAIVRTQPARQTPGDVTTSPAQQSPANAGISTSNSDGTVAANAPAISGGRRTPNVAAPPTVATKKDIDAKTAVSSVSQTDATIKEDPNAVVPARPHDDPPPVGGNNLVKSVGLMSATPHEDPLADPARATQEPTVEERSSELKLESPILEEKKPKVRRQETMSVGVRAAVLPFELKSPTTALPESTEGFDNITASLTYTLHRNVSFLVEGGKESYLLTFNDRRSGARHEVMPSVFWAGMGARFSFAPGSQFNPFVQFVGGGSEAGMIGRSMLGLQWSVSDQFGMMGGLEYNLAAYRFQGETATSPKLGLNYGLMFNLFGN